MTESSRHQQAGGPQENPAVEVNIRDGIAWITINRPTVRNAINSEVLSTLRTTLERLRADSEAHLLVFTGAGDKAFVAGADINELASRKPVDGLRAAMQRLYDTVESIEMPTIAAVNGYAFGGGHELALACDIRIASANAQFALPETGLGIIPAAGGTQRLARLVGTGRATEIILTGRRVSAEEALRIGLVTDVVESHQLHDRVTATAEMILSKGPLAVQMAKSLIHLGPDASHSASMMMERLAQAVLYSTEEKAEGTRAFLESRRPQFPR